MINSFPARERVFITKLTEDLHLSVTWDEFDEEDRNLATCRFPRALEDEPETSEQEEDSEWEDEDEVEDEESRAAVDCVLKKYEKAPVEDVDADGTFEERYERSLKEKMDEWKRGYYKGNLGISYDDPTEMGDPIYRPAVGRARGVASWGWFYDYHYAPRISGVHRRLGCWTLLVLPIADLRGADEMSFDFQPGNAVEAVPAAYGRVARYLMYDPNSPILDFYPLEFAQDLNGKKQDWEAIVTFIDEERPLKAMTARDHCLTPEERKRNAWGSSSKFSFNLGEPTLYPSSLPGFFPPLYRCTCKTELFDLPILDGLHLIPGLCDGVFLGTEALTGFPLKRFHTRRCWDTTA
ncbi:uncharacterized protein LACBIDRAFT_303165 [Laccaria bicolor S238N-H82]|uniref:Predicted protein n=1 Tax=Laccaria bicolor (strain S238N-H82 / ATCC MYA-4686) TaxID=486041 RepID=B0DJ23_LACBS|nr:uncharacterized protein LACBIDRAFT_303165 [Laccaria bicolor S238N-H82]EDR05447.1 predicted protein [Laccaria bicolor S238N-H82]|eukprot:XP_001884005.1 predicted protein [Laccaria bicolor S238N-H82]